MMQRAECLKVLYRLRSESTIVVTTMAAVAPWARLSQSVLDFPSAGSAMGHAADFAMGLALAQPDRSVWVLNGDGSMLMSLGTLVTICQTPPPNLVLFVLENDTFEVTGNQDIPGAGRISFVQMARGAGFSRADEFYSVEELERRLPELLATPGPRFINLHIQPGCEPPPKLDCPLRIPAWELRQALLASHVNPEEVCERTEEPE
jgi:thiamine pyrophosphate-dependent acetolactate synthase large subunit-like protein